jgi:hypothetical protein
MLKLVVNTWLNSLMFLLFFSMLQTYLDLQILIFTSFFDPILKLPKLDSPVFPTLPNLVINKLLGWALGSERIIGQYVGRSGEGDGSRSNTRWCGMAEGSGGG